MVLDFKDIAVLGALWGQVSSLDAGAFPTRYRRDTGTRIPGQNSPVPVWLWSGVVWLIYNLCVNATSSNGTKRGDCESCKWTNRGIPVNSP